MPTCTSSVNMLHPQIDRVRNLLKKLLQLHEDMAGHINPIFYMYKFFGLSQHRAKSSLLRHMQPLYLVLETLSEKTLVVCNLGFGLHFF